MENNKHESLQSIKFNETVKKVESIVLSKKGKFVGFVKGTGNQPETASINFDQIEDIVPATSEEIANFILERISEGDSLSRI